MAARGCLGRCLPWAFGHFCQLSLNKLLYPNTTKMRKVDDRGGKNGKIVAPNADRLERRPLVPKVIQNNIGPENMYEDPVITAIWLRGSLFSKLCLLLDSNWLFCLHFHILLIVLTLCLVTHHQPPPTWSPTTTTTPPTWQLLPQTRPAMRSSQMRILISIRSCSYATITMPLLWIIN